MDTPKPRFPTLLVQAGIVLLALLLFPATRWLVLGQLRMELLQKDQRDPARVAQLLQQHPNDYPMHLAHALTPAPPQEEKTVMSNDDGEQKRARLDRLQALIARFPNVASVHATLLRYLSMGEVKLHRDEETISSGLKPEHQPGDKLQSDAKYLTLFDRAAEAGERLDPDNAYFPLMHALSLFDQRRDAEAIAALKRAGEKSRWEDYCLDEVNGRMQLEREVHGEQGAVHLMATQAAILYPHFAAIRSVSRMALYEATEAERKGHGEEGFAIRLAVMRSGSLMRVQSHSYSGAFGGIAISAISTSRPGGAPLAKSLPNLNEEQREKQRQERLDQYYVYLRSLGYEEEARWAQAEMEAGSQAREIGMMSQNQHPYNNGAFSNLIAAWTANLVLLSNLLLLLVLGGAAWLATRIRPRHHLIWWREGFGLLLAGGILVWQWGLFSLSTKPYFELAFAFRGMSEQQSAFGVNAIACILVAFNFCVPLLCLLTLTIVSKLERIPIATGVGRGLRRVVLPLGSLLLLAYGGFLLATVRQEASMRTELQRYEQHQGQYLAERIGRSWPGPAQ